jgi:hypothetical protein
LQKIKITDNEIIFFIKGKWVTKRLEEIQYINFQPKYYYYRKISSINDIFPKETQIIFYDETILYIPTCITNYDEFKHFFEHFR